MFRKFDIKKLRKAHPLPKGGKDIVVNRDELAVALAKTTVTIDKYRKGGMPVLNAGGPGTAYEFQLHDCWAWYHGLKASEIAQKTEIQEQMDLLRRNLIGDDYEDEMVSLSPIQRAQEYEAVRRYAETALIQGTLVRSAEITLLIEAVFGILRQQLLGLTDVMERRVGLSPEQSEAMEKVAKEVLTSLHVKMKNSNLVMLRGEEKPTKRRKAR